MIVIPIDDKHRVTRGIYGIWVLQRRVVSVKDGEETEKWEFVCNYADMNMLMARIMDRKVSQAQEVYSTLEAVQAAYSHAAATIAEAIRRTVGIEVMAELTRSEARIAEMEVEIKGLRAQLHKHQPKKKTPELGQAAQA